MDAAGSWAPDPIGQASWRWWDGASWADRVAPAREAPELVPLETALGRSLKLEQEGGSGTDPLQCDGRTVGLMHKPFAGDVTGETQMGAWRFDREGIVTGRARVHVEPSRQEIGLFSWDGIGTGTDGTLQFPDGRWFRLTRATQLAHEGVASPEPYDPSHAVWVWYGPDRVPLMTVRLAAQAPRKKKILGLEFSYTTSGTGKTGMDVWTDIHPAAASLRELPLVTLLGSFVIWSSTATRESVRRDRF